MAGARPHWVVERLPLKPGRKKKGAEQAAHKKKPHIRGTGICAAWGTVVVLGFAPKETGVRWKKGYISTQ